MIEWLNIPNIDVYFVIGVLIFFAAIEVLHGHYKNTNRSKDDWILEMIGFFVVAGTKTIQVLLIVLIGDYFLPNWSNAFASTTLWLTFPIYILVDDLSQYWYHRSAHEYNWLWKHHRVHHAAEEMGIMVSYRNSWVYYLLMPNLWWGGICTYLGMAPAVVLGLMFKQIIVTTTHSTWKWDSYLYKSKWLGPLTTFIEHIFITPAFHYAHHGKSMVDHVSDPNANFGNTFSIWDQLFGTAIFTRKFPKEFGLQTNPKDPWYAHLLYPFIKSPKDGSELSSGHHKTSHMGAEPISCDLKKGTYLYCQCGFSADQPFCNGSHHGTKKKPLRFEINSDRKVSLCTCKKTKTPPYCDNSHLS